jgi:hypothetical protein
MDLVAEGSGVAAVRVDMGTMATSESLSDSPRSLRSLRKAPAAEARTTSLTVPPKALLTVWMSSSGA